MENCKIPAIFYNGPADIQRRYHRYSNTLLVSLNNRISIRKAADTGVSTRPLAVTFPVTPLSEDSRDAIAMTPLPTHRTMSLADNEEHVKVAVHQ